MTLKNAFKVKFKVTSSSLKIIQLSSLIFFGEMLPFRIISVKRLKWPTLYNILLIEISFILLETESHILMDLLIL